MLQEVLEHIHNRFVYDTHAGTYRISGGMISLDFLLDGQRFWISGSRLNDGIYTYHTGAIFDDDDRQYADLADEEFDGTICGLAVPKAVIDVAAEAADWVAKYSDALNTPYQSESFGGYSYSKASGGTGSGSGGSGQFGWADVFGKKLEAWRKICW